MHARTTTQWFIGVLSMLIALMVTAPVPAWPGNGGGHGGGHGGGGGGGGGLPFAGCGTLVEGVECTLFSADAGGLYIVNYGAHVVGDRIYVQGTIDPLCVSYCQQGDGCITNATISDCASAALAGVPSEPVHGPPFSVDDLISLLDHWGACPPVCEWDLNGDSRVDARDLVQLVTNLD